jgi:hypothetical protein
LHLLSKVNRLPWQKLRKFFEFIMLMPKEMVYRMHFFLNKLTANAIGPPFPVGNVLKGSK